MTYYETIEELVNELLKKPYKELVAEHRSVKNLLKNYSLLVNRGFLKDIPKWQFEDTEEALRRAIHVKEREMLKRAKEEELR